MLEKGRFFVLLDTHVEFNSYEEAQEKLSRLTKGAYIIVQECVKNKEEEKK